MTSPKLQFRDVVVRFLLSAFLITVFLTTLVCCMRVSEQSEGDKKKVDISTPFGDVKVRTDAEAKDIGLPVYPGATPKPKDEHNGGNNANVNLSFGDFGLKVVALTYLTNDAPDKVLAFYRNELKTYGGVLECKGGSIGHVSLHSSDKDKDSKELKCDDHDSSDTTELKVGTEDHQRVVGVKPNGSGSEFSLVFVHTRGKEGAL